MNRMPILLAFVAGALCAVLLGAAAPAGKPVAWEYRLLELEETNERIWETSSAIAQRTRADFANDAEASAAARRQAVASWHEGLSRDGWLCMGQLQNEFGKYLFVARPNGMKIEAPRTAFSMNDVVGRVKKRDEQELASERSDGVQSYKTKRGTMSRWTESEDRKRYCAEQLVEELNRCGKDGAFALPIYSQNDQGWLYGSETPIGFSVLSR